MAFCDKCGKELKLGAKFCDTCGFAAKEKKRSSEIIENEPPQYEPVQNTGNPPAGMSAMKVPLLIAGAIILIAGIVAVALLLPKKTATNMPAQEQTSVSTRQDDAATAEPASVDEEQPEAEGETQQAEAAESSPSESSEPNPDGELLCPNCADEYLAESDLSGYACETLGIMRNEIYARHGREFKKQFYKDYFAGQNWYASDPNFNENMLNAYEKRNAATIKSYEDSRSCPPK